MRNRRASWAVRWADSSRWRERRLRWCRWARPATARRERCFRARRRTRTATSVFRGIRARSRTRRFTCWAIGGNAGAGTNPSAMLAAALGECSLAQQQYVIMNEVTTAATAFVFSHYFSTTLRRIERRRMTRSADRRRPAGATIVYSRGMVFGNNVTIPLLVSNAYGGPVTEGARVTQPSGRRSTRLRISSRRASIHRDRRTPPRRRRHAARCSTSPRTEQRHGLRTPCRRRCRWRCTQRPTLPNLYT